MLGTGGARLSEFLCWSVHPRHVAQPWQHDAPCPEGDSDRGGLSSRACLSPTCSVQSRPSVFVGIGEASNPGPKNNGGALSSLLQGLDLKAMLLPLITEMIQQAIAEILGGTVQQMGPRPQIDAAQTPGKPKGAKGADRVKGRGKQPAKPEMCSHSPPGAKARATRHSQPAQGGVS